MGLLTTIMGVEVRRRRTLARISQGSANSAVYNEKSRLSLVKRSNESSNQQNSTLVQPNKRRKVTGQSKEDKLATIIVDFGMAVNELYQLSEYESIISWVPSEFSKVVNMSISDSFLNFCESNQYKLKWDSDIENDEELKALPFRFQKKKLSEKESLLNNKFPFRQQTIERYQQKEVALFSSLEQKISVAPSVKSNTRQSSKLKELNKKDVPKVRPQEKHSKLASKNTTMTTIRSSCFVKVYQ